MTQPTKYVQLNDFSDQLTTTAVPGTHGLHLDQDFARVKQTTDQICTNLEIIQRDDTKLRNGIVHPDSLSAATKALIASEWTPRGLWTAATVYAISDVVENGGVGYVSTVAHTSGTFATDHAAGAWIRIGGNSAIDLFTPSGAGAVPATLGEYIEADEVLVWTFMTSADRISCAARLSPPNITYAIRLAITEVTRRGYGGTVRLPRGRCKITDTIVGSDLRGVRFVGDMGTVNLGPLIADGVTDSALLWGGDNGEPMFYFRRGHNITFEHLCMLGMLGSDSVNRASACVWIDENHENYRFNDCKFGLAEIGVRVCSGYNHTTAAWTPGVSAYDGATSAPAVTAGGYASDNLHMRDCSFGYCTVAGVSIESAQALQMVLDKPLFSTCQYEVHISACQGVRINDPTSLGVVGVSVFVTANATTGNIAITQSHLEGGSGILFECSNAAAPLGNGISFKACAGGDINIRGASGTVTIEGSILRTVSMKSAGVSLDCENSTLTTLDKTAALGNGPLLRLNNVVVTTTLSANALGYDSLQIAKTTFPAWTSMAKAVQRFASQGFIPDLLLGAIGGLSSAGGMDGVAFTADASTLIISYGAYLNEAGTWVATAATGGTLSLNATGFTVNKFSGATVGGVPTFVTMFASDTSGATLPRFTTDPSATPGTMYYNTATSKVRIRDGAGWRDF
jgi:hypothetical protein